MSKSADAFRTISEVADWLGVQTHVLRFWESKFTQVKPVKRAGGRRYYRPVDMLLLGGIRKLLHDDGLTIKGVQKVLREKGIAHVSAMSNSLDEATAAIPAEIPAPRPPVEQRHAEAAPEPEVSAPTAEATTPLDAPAPFIETEASESAEGPEADTDATIAKFAPGRDLTSSTSTQEAEDAARNSTRPSFTEDAVVMPDTQADPESDTPAASAPPSDPPVETNQEAITSDFEPPLESDALPPDLDSPAVDDPTEPEQQAPAASFDVAEVADADALTKPIEEVTSPEVEVAAPLEAEEPKSIPSELPDAESVSETEASPEFVFRSNSVPEPVEPTEISEDSPTDVEALPDDLTAPDPEPSLPSFMRRSAPLTPPSENAPSEPDMSPTSQDTPPSQVDPSSPSAPIATDTDAPTQVSPETSLPDPSPTPIIIDVPDTPADDDMPAEPALLSKISATTRLSAEAAPLLERLATLRDKMAAARKE